MILAGDVGGTKTRLGVFEDGPSGLRLAEETVESSQNSPSLEAIVRRFLHARRIGEIGVACFGVAGAVVDGRCTTTNLPWTLDERELAELIPAARVKLVNDLEAAAWGVMQLSPKELAPLQDGARRCGNMGLIAAGTGLGEALMVWDGSRHLVVASEGGHADFAPTSERQAELLGYLRRELGHVSYERVVSGPGLFNIYRFLRDTDGGPEPAWLRERLESGDRSAVVTEVGLAGEDARCVEALDLFASIYGAEAGNLALKALAVGGVFVGGGIAPRMRTKLADGSFCRAFRDKGRFADLMRSIPVSVALNPRTPLLGAARVAAGLRPAP
jgi:glucokinase